jgi:hypothetical protein
MCVITTDMLLELRGGVNDATIEGRQRGRDIIGYAVVLDDEFSRNVLANEAWHATTAKGYPATNGLGRKYLHRLVFEHYHGPVPDGFHIDHIDRNVLNALPSNLRAVTATENYANQGLRKNNSSGFRGVAFRSNTGKWRARLSVRREQQELGSFDTAQEAARAVNAAFRARFPQTPIPNPSVEP